MRGARPLKKEEIDEIRTLFSGVMGCRNKALFFFGANTGFRVSEILSITLGDLLTDSGEFKDRIAVSRKNMKGKKASRSVKLNEAAKAALVPWLRYLASRNINHKDDVVFRSIRGNWPICRAQAWKVLNKVFRAAGLHGKLGTHAMRKTFANNIYGHFLQRVSAGEAVDAFRSTSKALGHTDIKSTDQYLSFLTEDIDQGVDAIGV